MKAWARNPLHEPFPAQLELPTGSTAGQCRSCGAQAVEGLRLCRKCWGYARTLRLAREMLDEEPQP